MSATGRVLSVLQKVEAWANRRTAKKLGAGRKPIRLRFGRAFRPIRVVIAREFWIAPSADGPGAFDVYHKPAGTPTMVRLDPENEEEQKTRLLVLEEFNRLRYSRPEHKETMAAIGDYLGR